MWRHLAEEARTRSPLFVFPIGNLTASSETRREVFISSIGVSDCHVSGATQNEDMPDSQTVDRGKSMRNAKTTMVRMLKPPPPMCVLLAGSCIKRSRNGSSLVSVTICLH